MFFVAFERTKFYVATVYKTSTPSYLFYTQAHYAAPLPRTLHAKHLTVGQEIAVISGGTKSRVDFHQAIPHVMFHCCRKTGTVTIITLPMHNIIPFQTSLYDFAMAFMVH